MAPKTKVLIVEDEPMLRELIEQEIQNAGFETLTAVDGLAGLKAIEYDSGLSVVICDYNMPNMTGTQLVRTVREKFPEFRKRTSWIALTAHLPTDSIDLKESDFDQVFYKPISLKMLTNYIKAALNKPR
jgi:DNA-binding response OmpR family regulator